MASTAKVRDPSTEKAPRGLVQAHPISYVPAMSQWVARLCVGIASMVFLSPNAGRAYGLAPPLLRNGPEIPVDGVLKVPDVGTIVVLDAEGNAVPGELVAPGVWRPNAPFVPGAYEVATGSGPTRRGFFFQAVPTPVVPDDFVELVLSTIVGLGEVTRTVCCGSDPELSRQVPCTLLVGDPCPPEPYCVPVAYQQHLIVLVDVAYADAESPLVGQLDITTAVNSDLALGGSEVDPAAIEYCAAFDVHNWIDGSSYQIADCLAHTPEMLDDSVESPTYFGSIATCLLPPDGYTSAWCEHMRYECVDLVMQLSDDERQRQVALCQHYRELCEPVSMEPAPNPTSSSAGTGAPPMTTASPSPLPSVAPLGTSPAGDEHGSLRGVSDDPAGCSVGIHRAASHGGGLGWFALCFGAAWRFARKVWIGRGKSPTAGTSAEVRCR